MPGEFMKTAEVAEAFDVSQMTVPRWAEAGTIPAMRLPGGPRRQWRYPAWRSNV